MNKDKITVELTKEQFSMISGCIEYISANEREYSDNDEKTLKEVADIFGAEYVEIR